MAPTRISTASRSSSGARRPGDEAGGGRSEPIRHWIQVPLSDRTKRRIDEVAAREKVAPEALAAVLLDTALKAAAPPENTAEWREWRKDARRTFRDAVRAVYAAAKDMFVRNPARRPSGRF